MNVLSGNTLVLLLKHPYVRSLSHIFLESRNPSKRSCPLVDGDPSKLSLVKVRKSIKVSRRLASQFSNSPESPVDLDDDKVIYVSSLCTVFQTLAPISEKHSIQPTTKVVVSVRAPIFTYENPIGPLFAPPI